MKKNRNYFSAISLVLLIILIFNYCGNKSVNNIVKNDIVKQKPNIIFIMADDLTTQAISAYG